MNSRKKTIVINGHGGMTNSPLTLGKLKLITPEFLHIPYTLSVANNLNIEPDLLKDAPSLRPVINGDWKVYQTKSIGPQPTNVRISPWNGENEFIAFQKSLRQDEALWSKIDQKEGPYLDRDQGACLVVKNQDKIILLNHKQTKDFFTQPTLDYQPLFLYAPQVAKVKVLGDTSLEEILNTLEKLDPEVENVVLATCNAGAGYNKSISYDLNQDPQEIKTIKMQAGEVKEDKTDEAIPLEKDVKDLFTALNENRLQDVETILKSNLISKPQLINEKYGLHCSTLLITALYLAGVAENKGESEKAKELLDLIENTLLKNNYININLTQESKPITSALHKAVWYGSMPVGQGESDISENVKRFRKIAKNMVIGNKKANLTIKDELGRIVLDDIEDYQTNYKRQNRSGQWFIDTLVPNEAPVVTPTTAPKKKEEKDNFSDSFIANQDHNSKSLFAQLPPYQESLAGAASTLHLSEKKTEHKYIPPTPASSEAKIIIKKPSANAAIVSGSLQNSTNTQGLAISIIDPSKPGMSTAKSGSHQKPGPHQPHVITNAPYLVDDASINKNLFSPHGSIAPAVSILDPPLAISPADLSSLPGINFIQTLKKTPEVLDEFCKIHDFREIKTGENPKEQISLVSNTDPTFQIDVRKTAVSAPQLPVGDKDAAIKAVVDLYMKAIDGKENKPHRIKCKDEYLTGKVEFMLSAALKDKGITDGQINGKKQSDIQNPDRVDMIEIRMK